MSSSSSRFSDFLPIAASLKYRLARRQRPGELAGGHRHSAEVHDPIMYICRCVVNVSRTGLLPISDRASLRVPRRCLPGRSGRQLRPPPNNSTSMMATNRTGGRAIAAIAAIRQPSERPDFEPFDDPVERFCAVRYSHAGHVAHGDPEINMPGAGLVRTSVVSGRWAKRGRSHFCYGPNGSFCEHRPLQMSKQASTQISKRTYCEHRTNSVH